MNRYGEKAALLSDALHQQGAAIQADSEYQSALAGFWEAKADFDRAFERDDDPAQDLAGGSGVVAGELP